MVIGFLLCARLLAAMTAPLTRWPFKRGFDAYQHPEFYRQLGKDPGKLINAAIKRLEARFCRN